jgi:hypothetical protein
MGARGPEMRICLEVEVVMSAMECAGDGGCVHVTPHLRVHAKSREFERWMQRKLYLYVRKKAGKQAIS